MAIKDITLELRDVWATYDTLCWLDFADKHTKIDPKTNKKLIKYVIRFDLGFVAGAGRHIKKSIIEFYVFIWNFIQKKEKFKNRKRTADGNLF